MKNFFKAHFAPVIGVIVITAVIGFSMAACGGDGGSGGVLTITGLNASNGKYAIAIGIITDDNVLLAAKSINLEAENITAGNISGGQTTLNVYRPSGDSFIDYDGNDTVPFFVFIFDHANLTDADLDSIEDIDLTQCPWLFVTFNAGVGSGAATIP